MEYPVWKKSVNAKYGLHQYGLFQSEAGSRNPSTDNI